MKNLYLTICSLIIGVTSFAQNGQIQNGGFENWTNVTLYDHLVDWTDSNTDQFQGTAVTTQSTDAQLGTYSVEITAAEIGLAPDTTFGYVFHGTVGQTGPDGGIPFVADFDEVRFQYKSDIPVGDTMYLLYIRFDGGGAQIDMGVIPAAFGTVSNWTQGSVAVPAMSQAQLFIGFVMGDPFGNVSPTPGSWARIDNVEMFNVGSATTNVPDPSFENWAQQTVETPNNWETINELLAGGGLENANKTIDANSGTYGIEMTTYQDPNSGDTMPGFISMGPIDIFAGGNPFGLAPYQAQPTTFSGAYKYAGANGDQGSIQIQFLQGGIPVGVHFETFNDVGTWTTFSSALTLSGAPDSILFVGFSGSNPGSVLKLDDLSFSGGNVGVEEFASMDISIYPNPASDIVMIKAEGNYSFTVVDLAGNILMNGTNVYGVKELNVQHLSGGSYVVRINNETSFEAHKLIIR